MVRLDDDLALPKPWESLEIRPQYPELVAALRDCDFKTLVKDIESEMPRSEVAPAQGELFWQNLQNSPNGGANLIFSGASVSSAANFSG